MTAKESRQSVTLSSLWEREFFRFSDEELRWSEEFRKWLRESENELGKYLADVNESSPSGEFARRDVKALEQRIVRGFKTESDRATRLSMLAKVVYQLNHQLQKSIPQPQLAMLRKRDKNPFTDQTANDHKMVESWLNAEIEWITQLSGENLSPDEKVRYDVPVSLIVLSAALHCGLLDTDSGVALVEALKETPRSFTFLEYWVYSDLPLAWHGLPKQEIRRWYIDDRLACLIARVSDSSVAEALASASCSSDDEPAPGSQQRRALSECLYSEISKRLHEFGVAVDMLPHSLHHMCCTIERTLRSEIPSVLVEYLLRKSGSRSLLPQSAQRIYGLAVVPGMRASLPEEPEEDEQLELGDAYGGDKPDGIEPEWMIELRDAFPASNLRDVKKSNQKEVVKRRVVEIRSRLAADQSDWPGKSAGALIVEFAQNLLQRGSSAGNELAISSVKSCVLTVARRFGRMLGTADPRELPAPEFEELYRQVQVNALADVTAGGDPRRMQQSVTWAFREFHRFLVRVYSAQPVNEGTVFGMSKGLLPVDARIISVDDCYRVIQAIGRRLDVDPEVRQVAQIETVLGFFAGLRRMEGLGLQTIDCPGGNQTPIFVRAWEMRGLKTPNASRWIPLSVFIFQPPDRPDLPDLLGLLNDWSTKARGPERVLASGKPMFKNISDEVIFPVIHDALKEVTGDRTMHYHILRHSFATWTFLRLMISDLREVPELFPDTEQHQLTRQWMRESRPFRKSLYGTDLVTNDHCWAVSTLTGHCSPDVTLPNYLHCLDILSALYLHQSELFGTCSDQELKLCSGLHGNTAGDWLRASRKADQEKQSTGIPTKLPIAIARSLLPVTTNIPKKLFEERFGRQEVVPLLSPQEEPQKSWIDATHDLLFLRGATKQPVYDLAPFTGFEPKDAEQILDRAAQVGKLKLLGSDRLAHEMLRWPEQSAIDGLSGEYCCPVRPRLIVSRQLVKEYAAKLGKLFSRRQSEQKQQKQHEQKQLLNYYVRNLVEFRGTHLLLFPEPPDAELVKGYLELHEKLLSGAPTLWSRDGTAHASPDREWRKRWGLTARIKVTNISRSVRHSALSGQWLAGIPGSGVEGTTADMDSIRAFQYVMLMAAIRSG